MKAKLLILTLALGASTCLLTAQEGNPSPGGQRPPGAEGAPDQQRGPRLLPPFVAQQLDLTAEQKEQVAKLDAEVKAKMEKILTPEQLERMKEIHPPMGQGGPGSPNTRMRGPGMGPNARMGGPGMGPNARMGGPGMGRNAPMGGPSMGRNAPMPGGPNMPGGMAGQRPMNPLIAALDANKDGVIEPEEIARASEALRTLDKNGDGKLTPDEFGPPRMGGRGGFRGPGPDGQGAPGAGPQPPPRQQ